MGINAYEKAVYLDGLPDEVIAATVTHQPRKASPMSFMPVFPPGGAFTDVADDATAFGGSRTPGIAFNIAAMASTRELLEHDRAWARAYWDALVPHSTGRGSYVNFMNDYEDDGVPATFGAAKYERLARIKAEYDPENVFHRNPNIKPALTPACPPAISADIA